MHLLAVCPSKHDFCKPVTIRIYRNSNRNSNRNIFLSLQILYSRGKECFSLIAKATWRQSRGDKSGHTAGNLRSFRLW